MCHHFRELCPQVEKLVARHLSTCHACRSELQRLSDAMAAPQVTPVDDVDRLLSSIRRRESQPRTEQDGEALKTRVACAIRPFLGHKAADVLLQPVREDGRNLLSAAAPLLTTFLGRRAARHLISYVVETAIVRSWVLALAMFPFHLR